MCHLSTVFFFIFFSVRYGGTSGTDPLIPLIYYIRMCASRGVFAGTEVAQLAQRNNREQGKLADYHLFSGVLKYYWQNGKLDGGDGSPWSPR